MAEFKVRAVRTTEELVEVTVEARTQAEAVETFNTLTVIGFRDGEPREIELLACDYDVETVL